MHIQRTYLFSCLVLVLSLSTFFAAAQHEGASNEEDDIKLTKHLINGERDRILGQYEEALRNLEACLLINDRFSAAYYSIGKVYLDQSLLEDAEINFKKAYDIDPDNDWYLLSWAQVLIQQERFKEAAKAYKVIVKKHPNNPDYLLGYANTLMFSGDVKKALPVFESFEEVAGLSPDVSFMKYRYYVGEGKLDEAAAEIERLIKAFPQESRHYGFLADHYKAQGKIDEALKVFRRAHVAAPDNPYVQLSLAEFYDRNNKKDSAFILLSKAYENVKLDIDTKIGVLLKMYQEAERHPRVLEEALQLCEKLVNVHPFEAKSYSVSGDFLLLANANRTALDNYLKAVKLDPSRYAIWSQIMFIESDLGENDSLLAHSQEAINLFPSQPTGYLFNGLAHNYLDQQVLAIPVLKAGATLVIGNPFLSAQFLASLGDAYHAVGRDESSDSSYTASLSYDPNNVYVLNNYSYFLSLREEGLDRALEMSSKTIELEPNNASYLDTYGWILYKLSRFSEALEYLERSEASGGNSSAEVMEHLGDTHHALGNNESALTYWRSALGLSAGSSALHEKISSLSGD